MSWMRMNTVFKISGRLVSAVLVSGLLLLMLTGCVGSTAQSEVLDSAITQTPENVARVFAKSVFSGDYEKMLLCFPEEYASTLGETELTQYKNWSDETKTALTANKTEYLGTSSTASTVISSDKAPDEYKESVASISIAYGIASTDIAEIRKCDVRIFCKIDNTEKYQDVTMLVYKYNSNWYACVSADSGATDQTAS